MPGHTAELGAPLAPWRSCRSRRGLCWLLSLPPAPACTALLWPLWLGPLSPYLPIQAGIYFVTLVTSVGL